MHARQVCSTPLGSGPLILMLYIFTQVLSNNVHEIKFGNVRFFWFVLRQALCPQAGFELPGSSNFPAFAS